MTDDGFREGVRLVCEAEGLELWEVGKRLGYTVQRYDLMPHSNRRAHCDSLEDIMRGRFSPSGNKRRRLQKLVESVQWLTCTVCGTEYPPPGNVGFCTYACQMKWRETHPLRPHVQLVDDGVAA